jgi:putative SOS response-associated peptidase YedK
MCGRFTLTKPDKAIKDLLPLFDGHAFEPRFNIAPTQPVPVVRCQRKTGEPELVSLRWGLIPNWADDPAVGGRLINARCETVATKPAFRGCYNQRHCLVLADGFFEWQKDGDERRPHFIGLRDHKPFAFAGLWDRWRQGAHTIDSFTILTTDANDCVRPLHDRMPVILPRTAFDEWLHPQTNKTAPLERFFQPYPTQEMICYPVSARVNNVKHDDAACVAPPQAPRQGSLFG